VALELDGPARLGELRFDTLRPDGTRRTAELVGFDRGTTIERDAGRRLPRGAHVVWVALDDSEAALLRVRAVRGGTRWMVLR
jgi:hypothetical protein